MLNNSVHLKQTEQKIDEDLLICSRLISISGSQLFNPSRRKRGIFSPFCIILLK